MVTGCTTSAAVIGLCFGACKVQFFTVVVVKTVRPTWDPQDWRDARQDFLIEAHTPQHAERLASELFEPCDDIADVYALE
jgi:hypothetical protein